MAQWHRYGTCTLSGLTTVRDKVNINKVEISIKYEFTEVKVNKYGVYLPRHKMAK